MTPEQLRVVGELRCLAKAGKARAMRKARRIGLRELARSLDAHPSAVSRWETGQTAPRPEAAWKWAQFLGIAPTAEHSDGASPVYQPGESAGNDEAAGYQPAAPVEHVTSTSTAK